LIDTITISAWNNCRRINPGRCISDAFIHKNFGLGAASFVIATAGGVAGAKLMNVFLKKGNKINPMIGACRSIGSTRQCAGGSAHGTEGRPYKPPADARHGP
jgi:hypothetical protein